MTYTRPATFPGTDAEIEANRASHDIDPMYGRCLWCDCRPWGHIATWPCGTTDIPRVTVTATRRPTAV